MPAGDDKEGKRLEEGKSCPVVIGGGGYGCNIIANINDDVDDTLTQKQIDQNFLILSNDKKGNLPY